MRVFASVVVSGAPRPPSLSPLLLLHPRSHFPPDTPREDILCVLYDVFDFIRGALDGGGRVLIHCSQGVSRSVTLAVAWIMWTRRACYEEVFEDVKLHRGIANPNIGFVCQVSGRALPCAG